MNGVRLVVQRLAFRELVTCEPQRICPDVERVSQWLGKTQCVANRLDAAKPTARSRDQRARALRKSIGVGRRELDLNFDPMARSHDVDAFERVRVRDDTLGDTESN